MERDRREALQTTTHPTLTTLILPTNKKGGRQAALQNQVLVTGYLLLLSNVVTRS
jgi:hypothetical protein